MASLMYTRHLSTLLAMPLMAFAIAIIGGIPLPDILSQVIAQGAVKLNVAYTAMMFGAVLAELINQTGIAKAMIRFVAEFGGDNPLLLGLLLTLVTALLFSTLGGLGAVIMVGTVVLPAMLSLGIPSITAGCLFLFGIAFGGMFNLANWQLYIEVLKIDRAEVAGFILPFAGIVAGGILAFAAVEMRSLKNFRYIAMAALLLAGAFVAAYLLPHSATAQAANGPTDLSLAASTIVFVAMLAFAVYRHFKRASNLPGIAFATPLVPLVLVLAGNWDIIPGFVAGITFGVLSTWKRTSINTLTRAAIEGIQAVVPAVVLFFGLGMLLEAVMHPKVATAMAPVLQAIIPTHAVAYILVFTAIAPLALYRGPLNLWGMGSGLVKLVQQATQLGGKAIMGMLWAVGQIQGICDPANTQNLWVATYLGVDTQAIMMRTLPYAWVLAFLGLCMAVAFGFVPW